MALRGSIFDKIDNIDQDSDLSKNVLVKKHLQKWIDVRNCKAPAIKEDDLNYTLQVLYVAIYVDDINTNVYLHKFNEMAYQQYLGLLDLGIILRTMIFINTNYMGVEDIDDFIEHGGFTPRLWYSMPRGSAPEVVKIKFGKMAGKKILALDYVKLWEHIWDKSDLPEVDTSIIRGIEKYIPSVEFIKCAQRPVDGDWMVPLYCKKLLEAQLFGDTVLYKQCAIKLFCDMKSLNSTIESTNWTLKR